MTLPRLAFFPAPRTGELLYSVFARHARWDSAGPKATMQTLFGVPGAIASIDLPNRLSALEGRLPDGLTIDALIDGHTLAPYYCAFLPAEVRGAIRNAMRGDGGNLHLISGMAAFRLARVTRLRFCPDCLPEMVDRWGSGHWRRDHQLPSVLVCPTHGTVLRASTVDVSTGNRHGFIAATRSCCPPDAPPVTHAPSDAEGEVLLRLARASAALLDRGDVGPVDFDEVTAFYRGELRLRGLMRSRLKVDQVALGEAFAARFGTILGRFPGLAKAGREQGEWLATLARRQRKAAHPLEHLLMRDLLGSRERQDDPCGPGPWLCRNPLADHHGQPVVDDLRTYRNRQASVAVFSCGCGYRYTRSISATGELGRCRFKEFGPLLRPALADLVAAGATLRSVAKRLGVDPKTVASLAAELSIDTTWSIRPSTRATRPLAAPASPTAKSRSTRRTKPGPRRDWRRLDDDLAERVGRAVARVRSFAPPAQVTAASLERELLGRRGWIGKRRDKLPRTIAAIDGHAEAVGAFQLRRVDYSIAQMLADGQPLKPWAVMRSAGVRSDMLVMIEQRIAAYDQLDAARQSA